RPYPSGVTVAPILRNRRAPAVEMERADYNRELLRSAANGEWVSTVARDLLLAGGAGLLLQAVSIMMRRSAASRRCSKARPSQTLSSRRRSSSLSTGISRSGTFGG